MRICFFSDIHGNKYVLENFFSQVMNYSIDCMVFCGDVFGYYYYQDEILTTFRMIDNLYCILGNHDKLFLDLFDRKIEKTSINSAYGNSYYLCLDSVSINNINYVRMWPKMWELNIDGLHLAAFHGSPTNPLNGRIYPDTPLENFSLPKRYSHIILGHTHHKMVRQWGDTILLNPGSIGQQRDGKGCSYLLLDTQAKTYEFHICNFSISKLEKDVLKFDTGNKKLIEVLKRKSI